MRPTLYTVARRGTGRLSTMAKPRGGDWLDDEFAALAREGVAAVVCLLTAAERREVGLDREPEAAAAAGVDLLALPVPDRGVPDRAAFAAVVADVAARLAAGQHVVAHCRYGIGRASLLAAGVLVREGVAADDAWSLVEAARGCPVPDTAEQRAFVAGTR
jgi:protein-tyrosine phosphatase